MIARGKAWLQRLLGLGPLALFNLAILLFAAWVFVAIADEVREEEYLHVEIDLMRMLRQPETGEPLGPSKMVEIARDITALGSGAVLGTTVAVIVGFLLFSRRFAAALFLATASIGGATLNSVLKSIFGRTRPEEPLRLIEIDSLSFPSGHAMSSATIYLTIAVLLARMAEKRWEKIYIFAAALLLSFVIGFSRVYLGVHYPTDVAAGWAAGVAWAQVCWFSAHLIGRRRLAREVPAGAG
jgi:Membrane-associated phospholipid phosphatase